MGLLKKDTNNIEDEELKKIDAYFRATNYLSACQLYLLDNSLLKRPLKKEDLKANIVGHWGTVPGQNFIYVHLNRIIKKNNLNMIYISGPGHGGNALVANTYLEGSYTKIYPNITEDEEGLKNLFKQFSFPGGISSHVAPETPGSIHEGGELGYSLAHSYGAVLDNPDLIVACVVGDGEAETGPLATSWQLNKIINPITDGTVLPILHLNGYKIANPTIFSRMSHEDITNFFLGCGYEPYFVEGDEPLEMHKLMRSTLDEVVEKIKKIKNGEKIKFPMIILRTPKGWTGPKVVDGKQIEGSFRAHQVPIVVTNTNDDNIDILENWLRSYRPEELFDENGKLISDLKELVPDEQHLMGLNPVSNGGLLIKDLKTPNIDNYALDIKNHGEVIAQDMIELGKYIEEVIKLNEDNKNFRIFGPDEALSNRLNHIFNSTKREWNSEILETDDLLCNEGRVIDSVLSEHVCEGMLEGYLLTGRHGFMHSYEAFIRIVDSMTSQHAKWLKVTSELPWRKPIASLNYILTSHIWQQDHNGFTHQDPGFLNHLVTKKSDIVRIYLPADTNCLISCFDHCIKSKNYINAIVASKHERPQWLSMDEAKKHCEKGIGIWDWASNDKGNPDIIMACAGDTPTLESLAATSILNKIYPGLKIRFINIVDLMKLEPSYKHPHGLSDEEYDSLFPNNTPVIFNFHGYPNLIHQLTYKRKNDNDLHVHGYKEEGTITTPFDMRVQNHIDRYHIVRDALQYLNLNKKEVVVDWCNQMLEKHNKYIREYGKDMPEVLNWKWENKEN